MNTDRIIAALQQELAGYMRRGLHERAQQVEEQIARFGGSPGATPRETVPTEPGTPQEKKAPRKKAKP